MWAWCHVELKIGRRILRGESPEQNAHTTALPKKLTCAHRYEVKLAFDERPRVMTAEAIFHARELLREKNVSAGPMKKRHRNPYPTSSSTRGSLERNQPKRKRSQTPMIAATVTATETTTDVSFEISFEIST